MVNIGIVYRKNSFLQPLFDRTIYKIIEIGLISKWEKVFKLQKPMPATRDLQLKLVHFHGCLFICGILYLLATIIFFIEMFWFKRLNRLRNEAKIRIITPYKN